MDSESISRRDQSVVKSGIACVQAMTLTILSFASAVTLELKTHEVYRGYLDEVEDNWNLHITNITRTEVCFFCVFVSH